VPKSNNVGRAAEAKQSVRCAIENSQTPSSQRSADGEISTAAIHDAVQRILASRTFRSAEVQRKFLRYAVEETVAGRGHLIKEYVIGVEALGRGESFDPRLDPIVRTEARKLRARLAKYYAIEAANEPMQIEFPKGSYVPSFRTVAPGDSAPATDIEVVAGTSGPADEPAKPVLRSQSFWKIAAVVAFAAAGLVAGLFNLARTIRPPATNSVAYQNYQRGRHFFNQFTPEGLKTATAYFERAVAEDPSFARGYTALADSYVVAPQVLAATPAEVISQAKAAANKALELDGSLGEAHFDLGVCAEFEFDWLTADREFRKGLALTPESAVGHLWYAKYLALTGRKSEVLTHRRIAAELDPVSPYALQAVAGYFSVMGRYDQAIELFRNALTIEPRFGLSHQGLGVAYLLKGMHGEAIAELKAANELMGGPKRMALLGYAYGVAGEREEAYRILNDFLVQFRRGPFPALSIAQVYIGLGEKDRAFEWLDRAIDQRDLDVTLQWDSPYESLRADPRFVNLLRKMKLA
jgi:tetratricopeptide (TPR) repeat protein